VLSISASTGIFLYLEATDMRKSFRGLSGLVYAYLWCPQDGHYYVFVNRRRTHVKILYWDGDGLAVWYKRLEKGQFVLPQHRGRKLELDRRDLSLLLEGVTPLRKEGRFTLKKS
jgi:transposase